MDFLNSYKQDIDGDKKLRSVGYAILAASLYGISSPVSKILLVEMSPTLMAALLYLGAGIGMSAVNLYQIVARHEKREAKLTAKEAPYIVGMIILDIAAPILLMIGLTLTTASNVSLLNNFEIVATTLIAFLIFKEIIGTRMGIAIVLITLSSMILSFTDISSFSFSIGSVFVILACISWGFENNCTRMLSLKNPLQIVVVKGFGSGIGSLIIFFFLKDFRFNVAYILLALLLGFVSYGLSIFLYIKAQRELGAARTSAFYAAAPFIGVIASWIFLKETVTINFIFALFIMLIGTYLAISENHSHRHLHHEEAHEHMHNHEDGHHSHNHGNVIVGEHTHDHKHEKLEHTHQHLPDLHHRHSH